MEHFVYLLNIVNVPDDKLDNIFEKLPKPIKSKAMTLYESILNKGRQEAQQEGMQYAVEIFQLLLDGQTPEFIAKKMNVKLDFVLKIKQLLMKSK